jgi:hypothetical protein
MIEKRRKIMRRGDNTQAFGGSFLLINLVNETGQDISKAVWKCGAVVKTYMNPVFPLDVNLTSEESRKLDPSNVCYLAVWDMEGRKKTCQGKLVFTTDSEAVDDRHCG